MLLKTLLSSFAILTLHVIGLVIRFSLNYSIGELKEQETPFSTIQLLNDEKYAMIF